MAVIPVTSAGTVPWPKELSPQATATPLERSAMACASLICTSATSFRPAGTFGKEPHFTMVPSALRARLEKEPARTATTPERPGGGVASPTPFPPQPTTVPSLFNASACLSPAAIPTTPFKPAGTFVQNGLSPHATTVLFDRSANV